MFHVLLESPVGYGLLQIRATDEIGLSTENAKKGGMDLGEFSRGAELVATRKFLDEREALDNVLKVSEGELTDALREFLSGNVPKKGKGKDWYLGVVDPKLGSAIQDELSMACRSTDLVQELARGGRQFLRNMMGLEKDELEVAARGLGHAYSRTKIKFNVHRQDNMIIQAIQLLDQLDKDVNTNAMRVREWYGWHFPELAKHVSDAFTYARLVGVLGDRYKSCSVSARESTLEQVTRITDDPDLAATIVNLAVSSMGMAVSEADMQNIASFATRVDALSQYRQSLYSYLGKKMEAVAPNLNALLGEAVGARLISHAGSLTKLSKLPASTVQILGAEKALFRALKQKGNTPKFGLLFNSTFISRAAAKNKGRISRYLANKCSLAARIDSFSDQPTSVYGEKLRQQIEDRLEFYDSGKVPKKNVDVMMEVKKELQEEEEAAAAKDKKKSKKRRASIEEPEAGADEEVEPTTTKKKKAKKAKKSDE